MSLPELVQGAVDVDVTIRVGTAPHAGSAASAPFYRVRSFDGQLAFWPVTIETIGADFVLLRHVTTIASLPVEGEYTGVAWVTIAGRERESIEKPILRAKRRNIPRV